MLQQSAARANVNLCTVNSYVLLESRQTADRLLNFGNRTYEHEHECAANKTILIHHFLQTKSGQHQHMVRTVDCT